MNNKFLTCAKLPEYSTLLLNNSRDTFYGDKISGELSRERVSLLQSQKHNMSDNLSHPLFYLKSQIHIYFLLKKFLKNEFWSVLCLKFVIPSGFYPWKAWVGGFSIYWAELAKPWSFYKRKSMLGLLYFLVCGGNDTYPFLIFSRKRGKVTLRTLFT